MAQIAALKLALILLKAAAKAVYSGSKNAITKMYKFLFKGTGKIIKSADNVIFKQSSLDKAFSKHSKDFGNYKDGSNASVNKFKQDIMHLINTGNQKLGTWKGVKGTHIYNEKTRQWAFINENGTFNTAFKLDDRQWGYLIKTGAVK